MAGIDEVFALICPVLGCQMCALAFTTFSADIHKMVDHIDAEPEAPRIVLTINAQTGEPEISDVW